MMGSVAISSNWYAYLMENPVGNAKDSAIDNPKKINKGI